MVWRYYTRTTYFVFTKNTQSHALFMAESIEFLHLKAIQRFDKSKVWFLP